MKAKKRIVGVFGQKNHGKTTLARMLAERLNLLSPPPCGYGKSDAWSVQPLMTPLKQLFVEVFGLSPREIEGGKRTDATPEGWTMGLRQALQHVGTEGFQKVCPTVWLDFAMRHNYIVIDDGRRFSEARRIREEGGFTILVWRPGHCNNDPHETERQMGEAYDHLDRSHEVRHPDFDAVCRNASDLNWLQFWTAGMMPGLVRHWQPNLKVV